MAKRKWYVVTVGREIGVFPTWLDVCPLVEGVSGASHQSFPTKGEADQMFSREEAKGNTRVVQNEPKRNSPRKARINTPAYVNTSKASTPRRSPAESSFCVRPDYRFEEPLFKSASQVRQVYSQASGDISRAASEQSAKVRRSEVIEIFFDKQTLSSNQHAYLTTPKSASASFCSVKIHDDIPEPEIILKTPPWVPSYPKISPEPHVLSPLDNPSLRLHSFKDPRLATPTQSAKRLHKAGELRSPATPESSIYMPSASSPVRPIAAATYMHDVDPRSPIVKPSQTELMSMNALSFARPSPSMRRSQLPYDYANPETSALFRENPTVMG